MDELVFGSRMFRLLGQQTFDGIESIEVPAFEFRKSRDRWQILDCSKFQSIRDSHLFEKASGRTAAERQEELRGAVHFPKRYT